MHEVGNLSDPVLFVNCTTDDSLPVGHESQDRMYLQQDKKNTNLDPRKPCEWSSTSNYKHGPFYLRAGCPGSVLFTGRVSRLCSIYGQGVQALFQEAKELLRCSNDHSSLVELLNGEE